MYLFYTCYQKKCLNKRNKETKKETSYNIIYPQYIINYFRPEYWTIYLILNSFQKRRISEEKNPSQQAQENQQQQLGYLELKQRLARLVLLLTLNVG